MEELLIKQENDEKINKIKKTLSINGITIWRILLYFIIYSFIGYIIETAFGLITKGVLESRQSSLHGPFCTIYGLGAVVLILCLHKIPRKTTTLFAGGFIVGSVTEYIVSLIGEIILNVKWWDYSDMPLNIDGRVCVYFSLFWGFLAIYLIGSLHPRVDKFIDKCKQKISIKVGKIITVTTLLFLLFELVVSMFAVNFFQLRMIVENKLDVDNYEIIQEIYKEVYEDEKLSNLIYKYSDNQKMIKTYPNLKIKDKNGNIIFFRDLLPEIQPYYIKVW